MPKVEIYTKPDCEWCVKAKQLLAKHRMPYTEYIYNIHFTKEELAAKINDSSVALTVPQIFLDGERVGGYDELETLLGAADIVKDFMK